MRGRIAICLKDWSWTELWPAGDDEHARIAIKISQLCHIEQEKSDEPLRKISLCHQQPLSFPLFSVFTPSTSSTHVKRWQKQQFCSFPETKLKTSTHSLDDGKSFHSSMIFFYLSNIPCSWCTRRRRRKILPWMPCAHLSGLKQPFFLCVEAKSTRVRVSEWKIKEFNCWRKLSSSLDITHKKKHIAQLSTGQE